MKKLSRERIGELFIFGELFCYSPFPIVIAYTTKILPPIFFASICILVALLVTFIHLLLTKQLKEIKNRQTIKYSLLIALFIVILPATLIYIGSSRTSGINTTILLQTEIIFTLLFFGLFKFEKITTSKLLGASIVTLGTLFILYNGSSQINIGNLLIICGVLFYPVGNFFAKKALQISSPPTVIFLRSLFGGPVLLLLSLIFEDQTGSLEKIFDYWPLIFINGIGVDYISKIFWYGGLKRIDVSKAIPLSLGGAPALSLIWAVLFLKEIPTVYQIAGFAAVLIGIFILTKKNHETIPQNS